MDFETVVYWDENLIDYWDDEMGSKKVAVLVRLMVAALETVMEESKADLTDK